MLFLWLPPMAGLIAATSGVGGLGELRLRAGGPLKLDTSGNNNNILIDSGTGDLLTNVGTNTLSAVDDTVAAIGLSATRGGITLSSSSASGSGDIRILSGGTLRLSTSANNSNILVQAGSGNINLSSTGTITLTGNTSLNNGTLRLNGLTYTFPEQIPLMESSSPMAPASYPGIPSEPPMSPPTPWTLLNSKTVHESGRRYLHQRAVFTNYQSRECRQTKCHQRQ